MATGSPQDLRAGLEEGCYKLMQKSNAKSAVWDKFVNSATLAPVGYVGCIACKSFLAYYSPNTALTPTEAHM